MSDDNSDWTQRVDVPLKFTVMSDTPGGYGNVGQGLVINDTETGLKYSDGEVDNHSARHEDGGADPIFNLGGNVVFPDRSYWNVYMSANQSISAGSAEKLLLDSVKVDNCNEFDAVNNEVVIETSGFYLLSINVTFTVGTDQDRIRIEIYKNGTILLLSVLVIAAWVASQSCNGIIGVYLTAGDKITIRVLNKDSDDAIASDAHYTNFSGCLIA